MITTVPTKQKHILRLWYQFDVKNKILGRISTEISKRLIGKSKPYYVPYLDCGDYVVVTNAGKIQVTGNKFKDKTYMNYSGYPGGLRKKTYREIYEVNPERIIREAISGMLPKNKLRASMLKRLFIYKDENHPYKNKFK